MAVPEFRASPHLSFYDVFWWMVDEPQNPMVINVLVESDGVWTPEGLRATLEAPVRDNIRLHSYPASRLANAAGLWGLLWGLLISLYHRGTMYWAPVPAFNIDDHIGLKVLQAPTDECLHRFVDEEVSCQLPKDQAQWRAVVIHNVPGGGSCFLFRIHHVVADGEGLGHWFHSLCQAEGPSATAAPVAPKAADLRADKQLAWAAPPRPAASVPYSPRSPAPRRGVFGVVLRLRDLIDFLLVEVLLAVYSALKLLFIERDSNSPLKGPNAGRKKTGTTLRRLHLPVEEVKALGKAYASDITVNDVLCTLLAGAFRRFFRRYKLHPEQMTMRVTVPMNMRRSNRPPIDMDNCFTLVFKSLPIHQPTVQERLATFHVRMGLMKMSIEPRMGTILMGGLRWMPQWVVSRALDHFTTCSSAVLTNVLTSRTRLVFAGQTISSLAFWVPTSGDIGLGISLCTYCDDINIGLIVDENLLDDLEPLLHDIEAEWAEMKHQLGQPPVVHSPSNIPLHPRDVLQARRSHAIAGHHR